MLLPAVVEWRVNGLIRVGTRPHSFRGHERLQQTGKDMEVIHPKKIIEPHGAEQQRQRRQPQYSS